MIASTLCALLSVLAIVWGKFDIPKSPDNPLHNTSSPEFKRLAAETYSKIIPCLTQSPAYKGKHVAFAFPDDALKHHEYIKLRTFNYRHGPVSEYAGYSGPWMENIFINDYFNSSLHHFAGLIPLFIQFNDFMILPKIPYTDYLMEEFREVLRPSVIYLAISQNDIGLGRISETFPNILVMSAGGYGHIPLPLIKSEIATIPLPEKFNVDMGFFGTTFRAPRPDMLPPMKALADSLGMIVWYSDGPTWIRDMANTKFNLAPRGYGRTSYRLAECIQMGRIPAYIYDDIQWSPYEGSNASIEVFGFVGSNLAHTMEPIVRAMKNMTEAEFQVKMHHLRTARSHYTYEGMYHQIEMFLRDPFGPRGGDLKCARQYPKTQRCCG